MLTFLTTARRRLCRVARAMNAVAGWLFVACAVFVTVDVLGRKFFGVTSQGTTELTGYMLAFGIAWSLAHGVGTRSHIRVDMLVNRMPLGLRATMHVLALAFLAVMSFFFVWRGWAVVLESWEFSAKDTSALSVPLVVPQGLWAVGLTMFFALTLVTIAEALVLLVLGRPQTIDRLLGSRTLEEETKEALAAAGVAEVHR